MSHWAYELMLRPWPGSCLDFARHVIAERTGLIVPGPDTLRSSAWRREPLAAPDCLVLMRGAAGRHAGTWLETAHKVGVLHAHNNTVRFETLHRLQEHGYGSFEFWRGVPA